MKLTELIERLKYKPLDTEDLNADPIKSCEEWIQDAIDADLPQPNAMSVSTVSAAGYPSTRIVLLKEIKNNQFIFYTNYKSNKGSEIQFNNKVCLGFHWSELNRQLRIWGEAHKTSYEVSEKYFKSRPIESQVAAYVSAQSQTIKSRDELEKLYSTQLKIFKKRPESLKCPEFWGGYAVTPARIEFWQGRESRLHDRILFTSHGNKWSLDRLCP